MCNSITGRAYRYALCRLWGRHLMIRAWTFERKAANYWRRRPYGPPVVYVQETQI